MRTQTLFATLAVALLARSSPPAAAAGPKVAVLPLHGWLQARSDDVRHIEVRFHRELRKQGADMVPLEKVLEAMKAAGAPNAKECDDACMGKIGEALGAERVLCSELSLQRKEQSAGTAWIWRTRQYNVTKKLPWGVFQRMCMCHPDAWDGIAERQVGRMLSYDPDKVIRLPPGAPAAKPTKGPRDEPGMVFVPAGPYARGFWGGELDEEPVRIIEISAFFIDKYEVTNGEYTRCVEARKCQRQRFWHDKTLNDPTHAVVGVGWNDGVSYCRFAGKRLPTEAEWEKAARGTDQRIYPWGDDFDYRWVNMHWDKDGFPKMAPPGSFPKNVSPYGAYDMAGNAWEWVHDFWHPLYYERSPDKDPQGPERGVKHVMRGGSTLYDVPFFVTATNRSPGRPWVRKYPVGFRCAKSL